MYNNNSRIQLAEVSCIGVEDEVKGEVPIAIVVLKQGYEGNPDLEMEMKTLIREEIGTVATPKAVYFVKTLPKTRSGKVIRRVIKNLAEGKEPGDLSTIEDSSTIDKIKKILEQVSE